MLRLIISLFLVFGIPIIPNAAGIYDDSLINVDKKKLENIKADEMHFLNDNLGKAISDYDIELISILKKNALIHNLQDKPLSYQQFDLTDVVNTKFIQVASNDKIDVQALLETEMVWMKIKADLNYGNILLNTFDKWTTNLLDKYLGENINTNLVLVTNIQTIRPSNDKLNFYENPNRLSSMVDQSYAHVKSEDYSYKISSSNDNGLNNAYGSDGDAYGNNGDKENILSIIYLWKMYSDTIIVILVIAVLWLIVTGLLKFLTRNN